MALSVNILCVFGVEGSSSVSSLGLFFFPRKLSNDVCFVLIFANLWVNFEQTQYTRTPNTVKHEKVPVNREKSDTHLLSTKATTPLPLAAAQLQTSPKTAPYHDILRMCGIGAALGDIS